MSAIARLLAEAAAKTKRWRLQEASEEAELAFAGAWEAMVAGTGSEAECHAAADRVHDLQARVEQEGVK